jgi:GTPase SAR1 family protein
MSRRNGTLHDDGPELALGYGYPHQNGGIPSPPISTSGSSTLNTLLDASGDHAKILKVLEELREIGIDESHSLPQIIVCGSQSSGKSSVLEALAGIPFPRKSGLCTRYKTRVTILRRPQVGVSLKIIPDPTRKLQEIQDLSSFYEELGGSDWRVSMPAAMERADQKIFGGSRKGRFTNDTLVITITDPDKHQLELLDLPGLINVDKDNDGSPQMVEEMVMKEMKQANTIVLAVARAIDDLEHHTILQKCVDYKIESWRTLGVLTMPDMVTAIPGKADWYVRMVQGRNEDMKNFSLPWHALLNRDEQDLINNTSQEERDRKEKRFFEDTDPWSQLHPKDRGIEALRERLSVLLFAVAKRSLPTLFSTLASEKIIQERNMDKLGGDLTEAELKKAFKESVERLKEMARDHSRGYYESNIRDLDSADPVHLRSRVVEQNEAFRDRLLKDGHGWDLEGRYPNVDPDADLGSIKKWETTNPASVVPKSHAKAVSQFTKALNDLRGRGLPAFNNIEVVYREFWRLTDKWKQIAQEHVEAVFRCCLEYFNVIAGRAFSKTETTVSPIDVQGFGNGDVVAGRFIKNHLTTALEQRKDEAICELKQLEGDRLDTPQNADRAFLKKLREKREERDLKRAMDILRNTKHLEDMAEIDASDVARITKLHTQEDWTAETAMDLLSALWAHYDVSD